LKRKASLLIGIAVLCLALVTGCGSTELSDKFDRAEVESSAKEVIQLVNAKDGEAIRAMGTTAVKEALTDEQMKPVYAMVDEAGEFKDVKDIVVVGQTDKKTKTEYAVAVAKAEYENKTLTYTISFTTDMKLAGLYVK